jgi:hypothetical protein
VDATNDFDNCTFSNGYTGTATLLRIDNSQVLAIDRSSFPTSTTTKNVTKTLNQGSVTFVGATGAFSGPVWEDDVNSRIHWAEHGRWEGTVSTDWNTGGNWGFDLVPDSTVDVVNTLDFTLNGAMTVNDGNMLIHGAFTQAAGGS